MIIAGWRTILSEITQQINSIWNNEEMLEEWKQSVIVSISKEGDKTDCKNYRCLSHLSITYKIIFTILLSRLTSYAEELIGNH